MFTDRITYYNRVTAALIAFFAMLIINLSCIRAGAASWPLFRATPQRTGAVTEHAAPRLLPRWSYQIQGSFISSPVVYKGLLYVGGRDFSVLCLNAQTGQTVWQYSTGGWVDATPCVSSDTVYVPSRDQSVYAFDRLTGQIRWNTITGSADCSSPVLVGGKLYFLGGSPEKSIYCLDAANGTILATYPVSQFGFSSPAVYGNYLYFGTNDGIFHCLDVTNGQVKWNHPTNGGILYSSLAAGANAIYAVSGGDEHKLLALNPDNGNVIWQSVDLDTQTAMVSSVTLAEDRVVVASSKLLDYDNSITALQLFGFSLDGATHWNTAIGITSPMGIISSPAVADGTIYIGSGDGCLYCLRLSDGKFIEPGTGNLSSSATGFYLSSPDSPPNGIVSSPAVSNGWVYVGTSDGMLWAFEADNTTAISSPDNGDLIVNRAQVFGSAHSASFTHYRLAYGKGETPSLWNDIILSSSSVTLGALASWDTTALTDGQYSLRLSVDDDLSTRAENRISVDNSPSAPSNLVAEDTLFDGGGSVTLSWGLSADDGKGNNDVVGYRVYKSTSADNFALLTQVPLGTKGYIDNACPTYTTFYYLVTALDHSSESAHSIMASGYSVVDGVEISPDTGGNVTMEFQGLTTEVDVPPGSISQKIWVGIRIPPSPPDSGIPTGIHDTKIVREFGMSPSGIQFSKPAIIKIPYRPQDVGGMNKEDLRIYWWDEVKEEWRIVNTSDPSAEDGRVWAAIPHFSLYRVMEFAPGQQALLSADSVYTYPNPAKGDRATFKYYLGDKADVFLDIYNVAGELIAHLEKPANPAGIVSEIDWNISSIASGVYVYRLEARSASETKSVKKKMAIIH